MKRRIRRMIWNPAKSGNGFIVSLSRRVFQLAGSLLPTIATMETEFDTDWKLILNVFLVVSRHALVRLRVHGKPRRICQKIDGETRSRSLQCPEFFLGCIRRTVIGETHQFLSRLRTVYRIRDRTATLGSRAFHFSVKLLRRRLRSLHPSSGGGFRFNGDETDQGRDQR